MSDTPVERVGSSGPSTPAPAAAGSSSKLSGFLGVFQSRPRSPSSAPPLQPTSALTTSYDLHDFLYTTSAGQGEDAQKTLSGTHVSTTRSHLDTGALIRAFDKTRSAQDRIKLVNDVTPLVRKHQVDNVVDLWIAGNSALLSIEGNLKPSARTTSLKFLLACLHSRGESFTGPERNVFYHTIVEDGGQPTSDFDLRLQALDKLTNSGRNIEGFEKEVCQLISSWLGLSYDIVRAKMPKDRKAPKEGPERPSTEERNVVKVFTLLKNLVKSNFPLLDEEDVVRMIKDISEICLKTSSYDDMDAALECYDAIVRYGYVPDEALEIFVELLCRVMHLDRCHDLSKTIMTNLLKSHVAYGTVRVLIGVFDKEQHLDQRALPSAAMLHLSNVCIDPQFENLNIPLLTVLEALQKGQNFIRVEVQTKVLTTLYDLLVAKQNELSYEDWDLVLDLLGDTSTKVLTDVAALPAGSYLLSETISKEDEEIEERMHLYSFAKIIFLMQGIYNTSVYTGSKRRFIAMMLRLHAVLPEASKLLLLDYHKDQHLCLPSSANWLKTLADLVDAFYPGFQNSTAVRLRLLSLVTYVYHSTKDFFDQEITDKILLPLFHTLSDESDAALSAPLLDLIENVAVEGSDEQFPSILELIRQSAHCKCKQPSSKGHKRQSSSQSQASTPSSATASAFNSPLAEQSMFFPIGQYLETCKSTLATLKMITLFQTALYEQPSRCLLLFLELLNIFAMTSLHTHVRLAVLRCLVRLRVDSDHRLYITDHVDAEQAAEPLHKLQSQIFPSKPSRQGSSDPTSPDRHSHSHSHSSPSHSISLDKRTAQQIKKSPAVPSFDKEETRPGPTLWSIPEILPFKIIRTKPSIHVVSYVEGALPSSPSPNGSAAMAMPPHSSTSWKPDAILPIGEYLAAVHRILIVERDWELYSYVLTYLPLQLANKHLFCGCSRQIIDLRKFFYDSIYSTRTDGLILPPEVKRQHLYVASYQSLTVLISYRRLFSKKDQDEMVNAFAKGLQPRSASAKPCIHALNICAFELPMSMTKLLPSLLYKLSQIMTTATMSVHILEFLSGLARLPNLYANFTDEDYKRVFGIAVQYIQFHSREERSSDVSMSSYVLIMAYHVIAIFYMGLRLSERRKYVPYITRQLMIANEKRGSLDEPTEVCLDMLNRYAYSNVSPKPEHSTIAGLLMGEDTVSKVWLVGHSFVTVRIAKSIGWAEVTVRRPSGTASFLCKVENLMRTSAATLDYSDAVDNVTLPAALMMHRPDESQDDDDELASVTVQQSDLLSVPSSPSPATSPALGPPAARKGLMSLLPSASRPVGRLRARSVTAAVSSQSPGRQGSREDGDVSSTATSSQTLVEDVFGEAGQDSNARSLMNRRDDSTLFDPSFLFLQLHAPVDDHEQVPVVLPNDETTNRALRIMDQTPVVDFHKIGVLYVGPGQTSEREILANAHGSQDYTRMVSNLGNLIRLKGCRNAYTGGLDTEADLDGKYAFSWSDDVTQMIFHVATLMPTNLKVDSQLAGKKRHIGNDFVHIVYNDSGKEYKFDTVPGQFNFVNIVVSPHSDNPRTSTFKQSSEHAFFKVVMQRRADMPEIGPIAEFKLLSVNALAAFVRQMAMHANVFAQVWLQTNGHVGLASGAAPGSGGTVEYVSHWRDRLRQIKRIRERHVEKNRTGNENGDKAAEETSFDFTRYT